MRDAQRRRHTTFDGWATSHPCATGFAGGDPERETVERNASTHPMPSEPTEAERAVLAAFIDAHQRGDAEASFALMREEIRVTMPPLPAVYVGRESLRPLLVQAFETGMGEWRLLPTMANRMPAAVKLSARARRYGVPGVQARCAACRQWRGRRDHHVRHAWHDDRVRCPGGAAVIANIDGLQLYYEVHGSGEPLVVLHGALGSVEMFGPNIELLAKTRQVIAVDLQGHGRTADIDRPLSCEAMADDVAALIAHLGFAKADVMGYSLGGAVALQTGIRHPERVRRLVLVSTVFARSGWFPEVRAGFDAFGPQLAAMMKQGPAYAFYASIAPRPQDFERVVEKLGVLVKQDYDWTGLITDKLPPTLIVAADADGIQPAHLVEMFAKLGGGQRDPGWDGSGGRSQSQLAILPGRTHHDIVSSPALAAAVEPFLR